MPNALTRILRFPIILFKFLRIAIHLGYGAWQAVWYPALSPAVQRYLLKTWSRELLAILGIESIVQDTLAPRHGSGCLLVSNHVSWLDIFVINAIYPTRFIAKSEVKQWPIIGWLCQRTGTHFVERAQKRDAANANARLSHLLSHGVSIGLFPEGTTTDGRDVAPFHGTMLQPALDAGVPVHPLALRYLDKHQNLNQYILFTGETTLVESLWNILSNRGHIVSIAFLAFDSSAHQDRKSMANAVRDVIASHLQQPLPSPSKPIPRPAHTPDSVSGSYGLLLDPIAHPHRD